MHIYIYIYIYIYVYIYIYIYVYYRTVIIDNNSNNSTTVTSNTVVPCSTYLHVHSCNNHTQVRVGFDLDAFTLKRPFFPKRNCSRTCANAVINFLVYTATHFIAAGKCFSLHANCCWTRLKSKCRKPGLLMLVYGGVCASGDTLNIFSTCFKPESSLEVQFQIITEFSINQDKQAFLPVSLPNFPQHQSTCISTFQKWP